MNNKRKSSKKRNLLNPPDPTDFENLFFEDYYGVKWNKNVISWSLVYDNLILPFSNENVDVIDFRDRTDNNIIIDMIEKAFKLWDNELSSITFNRIDTGNDADITIGIVDSSNINSYGYWNSSWNNKIINKSTIRIRDRLSENWFLTTMLHEIGNVLGLGDIKPRTDIQSVQEDPFPEHFLNDKLWDFDVAMIKHLYGETDPEPIDYSFLSKGWKLVGTIPVAENKTLKELKENFGLNYEENHIYIYENGQYVKISDNYVLNSDSAFFAKIN